MDLGPRGFDSKPLTLVVGPKATELYVPKNILLQIPYFQEKLPNDIPADYRLRLPDIDPSVAAEVLYFTWTKQAPQIETPDEGEGDEEWAAAKAAATRHTKAYVICKFWRIQWLEEAIIQSLLPYCRETYVNPSDIMILHNAGIQDSLLYKSMIAEFGWDFQYSGFESLTRAFPNFEDIIKPMPSTQWLRSPEISLNCETCKDCQECEDHKRSKQPSRQDRWIGDKAKQQDGIATDAREAKTA